MKRLLDVSVSILVVIALFMSQSWAMTAAYADYSIDGSDGSSSFHLEDSTSNQVKPISEGQESDAYRRRTSWKPGSRPRSYLSALRLSRRRRVLR